MNTVNSGWILNQAAIASKRLRFVCLVKRLLVSVSIAGSIALALPAHATGSGEPPIPRFTTSDNTVFAPDGSLYEIKGVNIFPWAIGQHDVTGIVDCWQFNTVRLHSWILPRMTSPWKDHIVYVDQPLIFSPSQTQFRTYDIAPLIETYTSQNIVVIVDIHELLGGYFQGQDLTDYLVFLQDFVTKYKDNPYVWIDLHNEPGNWEGLSGDYTEWRTESALLMDTVRAISPDMMMIVSGTAWGQDTGPTWTGADVVPAQSALLSNTDLIQGYDNLIVTFHMYDQWKFSFSRVQNYVDALFAAMDAPVFVGEYGSQNFDSTLPASQFLHQLVQQPGYERVGRSVWTWSAWDMNDLTSTGDGSGYLIDSCTSPQNLTALGQLVWDDNH